VWNTSVGRITPFFMVLTEDVMRVD
jgi:hypothetical protein